VCRVVGPVDNESECGISESFTYIIYQSHSIVSGQCAKKPSEISDELTPPYSCYFWLPTHSLKQFRLETFANKMSSDVLMDLSIQTNP